MEILSAAAGMSLVLWVGLVLLWGRFWWADQHLPDEAPADLPRGWPDVAAVIPARNEAETIAVTVRSLVDQDYPGRLDVIVVDDNSDDGTAAAAMAAAEDVSDVSARRVHVISGEPLEPGWTGKMWAVHQGVGAAADAAPDAAYVLLTDADIRHAPDNLRGLVAKAEMEGRNLVSLMVRLRCESFWERLLIPAFVFFFQKLYPFPWVNEPIKKTAAAAGGCMLVRRRALDEAGGIAMIRDKLIDDCALARLIKARGTIWLGLGDRTVSLRTYDRLTEIWRMVARTAYVQLGYSPIALIGSVIGMAVLYLVPPVALFAGALAGTSELIAMGAAAWGLMTLAYFPTLRRYGLGFASGLSLPVAGAFYTLMTVSSAVDHWRGRGGGWKGRTYGKSKAGDDANLAAGAPAPDPRNSAQFIDF